MFSGGNIKFTDGPDAREKDAGTHASQKEGAGEAQPGKGDGFHHHELHEHESGFHSKHTHPDGKEEHGDHGSYEEAKAHMDQMHGQEGAEPEAGAEDHGEPDQDDMPDFSERYSRG